MTANLLLYTLVLLRAGALVSGQAVYLSLGSTNININNTEVLITDIGEDAPDKLPSLICHTDLTECCRDSDTGGQGGRGEWYYPDGRALLNNKAGEGFYRLRNAPQVIRLARRDSVMPPILSPTGSYCCVIPTTGGEMTFCANIVTMLSPTTMAPSSTTMAPTTEAPTTMAPTTETPTTMTPTTMAPTTEAPTTETPTTMAPTTMAPTTEAPTTMAPTTMAPTTEAPTTMAPTTEAPTTMAEMTPMVYLSLGSTTITTNNTEVLITDIGEDVAGVLPSLTCHTDLRNCCRNSDTGGQGGRGEWYYPDGRVVQNNDGGENIYFIRNAPQSIRLRQRENMNPLSPTGTYCCVIPTIGGEMTFCANLVVCPSLSLTNGMISYSDPPQGEGSVATHSCDTGYTLNGGSTMTRTCQSDGTRGTWSGSAPTCEVTDCGPLTAPMNGMVSLTNTTFEGTATYSCDEGYVLNGASSRMCQANETWSSTDPTCDVLCPRETLSNGTVTYSPDRNPVLPEAVVTYSCVTGYNLTGNRTRTCKEGTGWTGSLPVCTIVDCGNPPDIASATVSLTTTTFGSIATYSCDTGYVLNGNSTLMCGADGTYSGVTPSCDIVDCGNLTDITNGMISLTTTTFGSTANYSCDPGYVLNGDMTRTCGSSGIWSSSEPMCNVPTITAVVTSSGPPMAGQNFSLTCSVTGADSLSPTISYQWTRGMTVLSSETNSVLLLNPLTLSDSGQYECMVTAESALLNDPLTDSDQFEVTIQVPPPTVTLSPPTSGVFVGESPNLTCTTVLESSVDTEVTVSVSWFNHDSTLIATTTASMSGDSLTYVSTTTLTNFMAGDVGTYRCDVIVSPTRSFTTPSNNVSATADIALTPPPSAPNISVVPTTTSLSYSWSQPQVEIVDSYTITFSYVGDCPEIQELIREMTFDMFTQTELPIPNLEEFSNYSLSVTAVNRAGPSTTSTLVTSTQPAAPSGAVGGLVASPSADSVTLQWERVPCRERNSEITGYSVTFGPTTMSIHTRNYTASGLIPRTQYSYEVVPLSDSGMGTPSDGEVETLLPEMPTFQLGGVFYPTHGLVTLESVGVTASTALLCVTSTRTCCETQHTGTTELGQWYLPDQSSPDYPRTIVSQYYQSYGPSVVRLHRSATASPRPGIYRCEVPVSSSENRTLYIGVYSAGQGVPRIVGDLLFDRAALTLTCTSTGGPVSEVVWTRNGQLVSSGNYTLSQTVTDMETGRYENELRAADIADLVGNFSCTVSNSRGSSDPVEVTLNGVQIVGDVPPFTVGGVATLSCVSDSDAIMMEWFDGSMTRVAMTTMGRTLNYTFSPVRDDLQGSEFTCRVTRTEGTGEQSIALSVTVPGGAISIATTVNGSTTIGEMYSLSCVVNKLFAGLTRDPTAVWMDSDRVVMTGNDITVTSSVGMAEISFNPLRASHHGTYRCVGSLETPAQAEPLSLTEERRVAVTIPPPGVSVTPPPSPLTAGTPFTLTCSITVNSAVDVNIVVDVTWVITTNSEPITTTSTATGSVPSFTDTLTIPVLSTRYTRVTCGASVRRPSTDEFIMTSSDSSASVTLTVQAPPPPVVTVDVTGDSVAGSALSLLCTATPPTPLVRPSVVSWVGVVNSDDVTVTNSSSVSESSITATFDPLRTSRGGVYMCRADYDIPEADLTSNPSTASTTVTIQIPRPVATITADPVADTYTVGLFLDLVCEVTLSPSVDSPLNLDPVWTRDGTPPDNVTQVSILPFTMSGSSQYRSTLRFSPLTREFIGNDTVYNCEVNVSAQNDTFITGTATNTSINITVEDTDFNVALSPDATVTAGSSHSLVCQGTRDPSIASATLEVEWFGSDGSPVPAAMVTGESNTTDPTLRSTLEFPSLNTSQAGEYVCRMNLTVPGTTITDRSLERRAVVRAQIPSPQVRVTASRTATLHEGTTGLVISCVVTPDNTGVDTDTMVGPMLTGPVPADGRRVNISDSVDGSVVTVEQAIQVLSLSDAGEYTCSVTVSSAPNSEYIIAASGTDSLTIAVSALPPPTVTIDASPTVQAGGSLTLTCSVGVVSDLASPPTIQWTYSGQNLSNNGTGLNLTLTFDPVRTSDADQYTCTATINIPEVNITDRSSVSSTDITVAVPPPTVTVTTSEPVYHGTSHTLSCTASYEVSLVDTPVSLVFDWTGPEGPLMSDALTVISSGSSGSTLRLSPVDHPSVSSGDYTCTVTVQSNNTLVQSGSGSDSVRVTVLAAPAPVVVTGVPVRSGRCGEVVSINCSASVVDNFVTRPVFTWRGPGGIVENDETLDSNLTSPGEYTCEACVTVESVGINNCSDTTVTITSQDPGQVSGLSCPRGLPSTLNVTWSPPSGQSVLSYTVQVGRYTNEVSTLPVQLEADEILSEGFTVTGPDITQEVRYLVSVEAGGGGGCGPPARVECYTEEGTPPMVMGVEVERLNGTAMNVSWTPLNKAQARGFIQRYIITYRVSTEGRVKRQTDSVEVPADQSSVVVGGLDPALEYGVQVGAQSQGGTSEPSAVRDSGPTPTMAPVPAPIGTIVGVVVVVVVFVVVVVVAIIVIVFLVRRHKSSKGQFKLSTGRNFELTSIESRGNVEPTAAHRRPEQLNDDLDKMDSEKVKEALSTEEEVVPQPPAPTSAEVLDRMKPISLSSFRAHVQKMHDDRAKGFEAEYQSYSLDPLEVHEIAKVPHNRVKNRFANIFPYDHSRVLLKAIPGVEGSDYINACWMDGYQRTKCYIAAQGPMPNSLDDFWRMIWEYKLCNVVMLTKCKEGGRVKCEQYWSEDIGSVFETENKTMSVTTLSVTPFADFVIRQFTVKNTQDPSTEPLRVTHYHFTAWPDHGVPKFATSLISFIRKTQRGHNKDKGPLLVHCSAGVGRTGTFITLDSMLERIHKETSVNVYAFVKQMRTQRVLMVQTLAQYSFIHDALDELITCGETDIPAGSLRTKFRVLSKVIPGKGITGFTNQFQLLSDVSREPEEEDITDANEHYNKDKNRYPDKVPFNMSRARLRPTGEDGSEYINASFVDGYKQRNAYIATQGPLRHTVPDFWRMLWEFKSKTVVMLCNSEEEGEESAAPYWPAKENEMMAYGKINVTLQSKAAYGDFSVRKFTIMEDKPAGAKQVEGFTVTLFHLTEWPRDSRPKAGTLIEMLDMITKSQMSTGNRPITVMCNDGVGRSGTFICIHAQLERLKTEGVVDFFQSIKSARIQRAGLVPDVTSYSFCHQVLADYIDKFDNYANFKDMI